MVVVVNSRIRQGSAQPVGRAFFQKGGDAFARFGGGALAGNALGGVFVGGFAQRAAMHGGNQLAGGALRARAARAQRLGQRRHPRVQLGGGATSLTRPMAKARAASKRSPL